MPAASPPQRQGDIRFSHERLHLKHPHPGGQDAFYILAQFPWHRDSPTRLRLEITHDEDVLLPGVWPLVLHGAYAEEFWVACHASPLEELCAEKLRSCPQTLKKAETRRWLKPRTRDFYDLWHLTAEAAGPIDWALVSRVLPRKCAAREVEISRIEHIFNEKLLNEVRQSWERDLGTFVAELPDVEQVLDETRQRLGLLLRFPQAPYARGAAPPPPFPPGPPPCYHQGPCKI